MLGVTRGRAKRPVQPPAGLFLGKGHNKPPNSQFPAVWAPSRAHPGVVFFLGGLSESKRGGRGKAAKAVGAPKTHSPNDIKQAPAVLIIHVTCRERRRVSGGLRHGGAAARGGGGTGGLPLAVWHLPRGARRRSSCPGPPRNPRARPDPLRCCRSSGLQPP